MTRRRERLLSQLCERCLDAREDRGFSELRKYPLCLGQMLKRESALSLYLVKQTKKHLRAANKSSFVIELRILQYTRHHGFNARGTGDHHLQKNWQILQ